MNRPAPAPVTAQLNSHTAGARRIVSELYALAGLLSDDLHAQLARERAAARQCAEGGLPVPATPDSDPADVRAALEHARELQALLPAALNLAEAVMSHLEALDDLHRLQINGAAYDELPPGFWSDSA